MEAVSDPATETVVIMSSSQVGKTEVLNNSVGYHIDQDPAPIMVVMPTERDAETWSKDRFSPMARDTPCLQDKIANPKSRDGNNKILHKRFPGGHLTIVGANAPSGLASRPIRLLLCDEVDRYPFSAGAEGDPVNLAKKRTVTFWNRKIVLVSTPTNKGASRIEAAFEESDQRRFWVPCPACRAEQLLTWGQVKWGKDENGGHRPETARYHCADCDAAWKDETRWSAISKGRWIADAPFNGTAGFHLNEIYSPWVRLEAMAKAFLSARAGGDETMKTFINTSLGETWMESGEAPDWQRLQGLKEDWNAGTVPAGGLFLTAGVDVQKDRIEVDVWAWGKGLQSWLIDHIVIEGGPGDQACWQKLSDLLGRTWTHASGTPMTIARLAIDTGYETAAVYAWARQVGFAQVAPVKGVAVRVPAEEVLHIYRPIDAGQIRGLPHVAPAMVRLFLLDQYDDAELDRKKKTAAMFAGFITKTAPEDPMMGEGAADLDGASIASLEPGTMQVLLPGEDVRFSSPADVGGG